jgi:hypothetical protein
LELIMRSTVVVVAAILSFPASGAEAAVPKSIAVLLGPSVGYLLSQSDLCEWGIAAKIENTYKRAFKAIGMTQAQQAAAWEQAKAKQAELAKIPAEAKARIKTDTCTTESRSRVELDISE